MTDRLILQDLAITTPHGERLPTVSCRVKHGDVVAIVGPSGVGKTSILRACLGILPEAFKVSGTCAMVCESRTVNLVSDAASVRGRIIVGWPQEASAALDPKWTVLEAVRASARDQGLAEVSATDALRAMDFPAHRDLARVDELSGGEARRAGIAAVLATGAPCVLLDEPTAGLSESGLKALVAVIRRHQAAGGSWLIATHDLGFAERIGARLVSMEGERAARVDAEFPPIMRQGEGGTILAAQGIGFTREAARVLQEVTLSLEAHRVSSLSGPSGAGKSTLCRILSGELPPSVGTVNLRGQLHVNSSQRPTGAARRAVHYTRQDARLALDPWRSARDLLREAAELAGNGVWTSAVERAAFPSTLLDRRSGSMSGGERQRLVLARAYAADPTVLLVDEALTGLDAMSKAAVVAGLEDWVSGNGRAALVVTHDQALAASRGWRGWQLSEGHLTRVGSTC